MSTTSSSGNFPLDVNSSKMGVISVTIPNPAASVTCGVSGTADTTGTITFTTFPVRSCIIQQYSGTQICMNSEVTASVAATSWKLSATIPLPVPVDDLAKLSFCGTAGDIVQILWRS